MIYEMIFMLNLFNLTMLILTARSFANVILHSLLNHNFLSSISFVISQNSSIK